ncbi:hypothetical protein, partial [Kingella denitrificans]
DDFLAQNQIRLCPEHYRFILDYGNSPFLTHEFADLSFNEFKDYYSETETLPDDILPEHYDYVGTDFSSAGLCIDPNTQKIHTFGYGEIDEGFRYGGLSELLFYCLFRENHRTQCFDLVEYRTPITDIEQFEQEYSNNEIKDVFLYTRFFFKDGRLIACWEKMDAYNVYSGGVLDQLA